MKIQEMWGIMKRPNIQSIGINEGEDSQVNVIDQIIQQDHKRKLSQTKEQHTHTATRRKQRTKEKRQARRSLPYATVKTPSTHNKESVMILHGEKTQVTYNYLEINLPKEEKISTLKTLNI